MLDRVGQQLGNYRLLRPLGHGGFADVYLGEHIYLNTQAAMKVLQVRLSDEDKQSFVNEARTIARLKHPSIIRVLEYDVLDNVPFLVMEYAPKGTLRQHHPRGRHLSLSTVVPYVQQVASALQYAHNRKLIHRDVKPENMLLNEDNAVLLSDFGLAVIVQSSRDKMQTVAGTVTYMAPEQLQGRPTPASDQYALAVVVYEWLSGERLFSGSFIEVASQHVLVTPPSLRSKNPHVSQAADLVIQKALAKQPEQRFKSVEEFANALAQVHEAERQIQTINYNPPIGKLYNTYRKHHGPVLALSWAPDNRRIASASADRTAHIWNAGSKNPTIIYREHAKQVVALAWSPDGSRVASGSWDTTVQVWNPQNGKRYFTYRGFGGEVSSVAWSPNNTYIAAGSWDTTVQVRQASTGSKLYTYTGHSGPIYAVAWAPTGLAPSLGGGWQVASASGDPTNVDNTVQIWNALIKDATPLIYRDHFYHVHAIAWSPDGLKIASASADTRVQIWDVTTGRTLLTYRGHAGKVNAVAWSPDGTRIASASDDHTVQIWNVETGEHLFTYSGHSREVSALAWSPNGKRLASAGYDATVQIWQAE